jgi:hypothetical protein
MGKGVLCWRANEMEHEIEHLPPSSVAVKIETCYASTLLLAFMAWTGINLLSLLHYSKAAVY